MKRKRNPPQDTGESPEVPAQGSGDMNTSSDPGAAPQPSSSSPSIGLNLRVTGYCNQGGRKYMEDVFSVAYQQTEDEKDLEYAFFGIFDGHGGREAAVFAKEHLMDFIVRQKSFWSDDDDVVLKSIHEGYVQTHQAMWKELEKWPRTASGLPSTAGTTASIAFIRRGKIFVGHVGDSAIILGEQDPNDSDNWVCQALTTDHKPESQEESKRIQKSGGKVVCKSGVPRVVWNRPKMGHRGPVRRSTHIDEIPFLAVARSLGDLWSYNSEDDVFVVSPEPDTYVYPIDITKHRCLILGTDGAWNMLTPSQAVRIVCEAEKSNEQHMLNPSSNRQWINPSKRLVDRAIERWNFNNLRADNTSIVTVMLDPPGPPRAQVLKRQRELAQQLNNPQLGRLNSQGQVISPSAMATNKVVNSDRGSMALVTNTTSEEPITPDQRLVSQQQNYNITTGGDSNGDESSNRKGISIISRFPNSKNVSDAQGHSLGSSAVPVSSMTESSSSSSSASRVLHDFQQQRYPIAGPSQGHQPESSTDHISRLHASVMAASSSLADSTSSLHEARQRLQPSLESKSNQDIQCNVITSSSDDEMESPAPYKRKVVRKKGILKESSRLSRELNALRLDSPDVSNKRKRSLHNLSAEESSDIENEEQDIVRPRQLRSAKKSNSGVATASHLKDVQAQCQKLNAKIRNIEKKMVKKTGQLNQQVENLQSSLTAATKSSVVSSRSLRSGNTAISTPDLNHSKRELRPRTPARIGPNASTYTPNSRKRKQIQTQSVTTLQPVTKSPRVTLNDSSPTANVQVIAKPVLTRSRTARVLQLKK